MVMNSTASSSFSRSNFLSTIVDSSIVTLAGISGLHFGEFTSTSTTATTTPCNQGLRQVYVNSDLSQLGAAISSYSSSTTSSFTTSPFVFPCGSCHSNASALQKYFVFGQTVVLSGLSAQTGIDMRGGIAAAFEEQNGQGGGIYGDQLVLRTLDDGYNAVPAAANAVAFVQRKVFGMIGAFGTATSLAAAPIVASAGIPFIGGLSGTSGLRSPFNAYYINIRASYADETTAMVDFLTRQMFVTKFSIMYQNDSYGLSGYVALVQALAAIQLPLLSSGSYPRNTLAVEQSLQDIVQGARPKVPEAIICFGVENPVLKFLGLAKASGVLPSSTIFMMPSPVATVSFLQGLGSNGSSSTNIYVTQVVPQPANYAGSAFIQDYTNALSGLDSSVYGVVNPSWTSLEAYIGARVAISTLLRLGAAGGAGSHSMDQASFVNMIYSSSIYAFQDLVVGPYSSTCNQGMKEIWVTDIANNQYNVVSSFNFFPNCYSDVSVLRPPFIFGLSTSLTGSSAEFGLAYAAGVQAAFAAQNAAGGVLGHKAYLAVMDDHSNVDDAVNNTVNLIVNRNILAMFGGVASIADAMVLPTLTASTTNATIAVTPFFGPLSGSMSLRSPFVR